MPEPNQAFWRGIRPTDPPENIPVDIKVCSVTLPVGIASVIGNLPVDIKAHTVNTPVDVKSHAVNTPVDIKSMTGNMPVDIKAHTVNTPVDIKSIDVAIPLIDSWLLQGGDEASVTDPLAGTVHLDTGQLVSGHYDIIVTVSTDANYKSITLNHRNAANSANLYRILFMVQAYGTVTYHIKNWYFETNERFRVTQTADMTGYLCGGMWWVKRT